MKHGSLFSGIGGFDLAAQEMGWENVFHCEWNKFGQKILKYYWPNAISYDDIKKTDFSIHRGTIDILTGGFPCQPYSVAGKRKGKEDERHLWPEMLRAIREIQPTYVVGENVGGLVSWNGGLVFNEVQTNLETEGYEVQAFILPACAKNAPHRRDRIWFVAYSDSNARRCRISEWKTEDQAEWKNLHFLFTGPSDEPTFTNSNSYRSGEGQQIRSSKLYYKNGEKKRVLSNTCSSRREQFKTSKISNKQRYSTRLFNEEWANFPTQSPVCNGNDGISSQLDGITFSKWRNESIKGGGNAIVPQVAFEIFKAISKLENLNQ
ncbi:DNA cytosine methyltransferase [Pedobacter cryophilus]|uniref:Cytosine-specific methyltransferase n=1 Tax=Pedobacter cryophilus TaxID=2571271 RepID=A0A4U1BZD6_9SPHI|nr:DNA (cytosine-5-)-methyltransferase [Pedobacter cryophilus]TKB96866.1 DNA (cytosine-5-)-methyltransferase [Pedobacter cryophilus]